jgi:hypothetical protein
MFYLEHDIVDRDLLVLASCDLICNDCGHRINEHASGSVHSHTLGGLCVSLVASLLLAATFVLVVVAAPAAASGSTPTNSSTNSSANSSTNSSTNSSKSHAATPVASHGEVASFAANMVAGVAAAQVLPIAMEMTILFARTQSRTSMQFGVRLVLSLVSSVVAIVLTGMWGWQSANRTPGFTLSASCIAMVPIAELMTLLRTWRELRADRFVLTSTVQDAAANLNIVVAMTGSSLLSVGTISTMVCLVATTTVAHAERGMIISMCAPTLFVVLLMMTGFAAWMLHDLNAARKVLQKTRTVETPGSPVAVHPGIAVWWPTPEHPKPVPAAGGSPI